MKDNGAHSFTEGMELPKPSKMLVYTTDDFSTIKEFIHEGKVTKLKLIWGVFEWRWLY